MGSSTVRRFKVLNGEVVEIPFHPEHRSADQREVLEAYRKNPQDESLGRELQQRAYENALDRERRAKR